MADPVYVIIRCCNQLPWKFMILANTNIRHTVQHCFRVKLDDNVIKFVVTGIKQKPLLGQNNTLR